MKEDTQWRLRDAEGKEYIIIDSKKVDLQEELNKIIVKQQEEIERLNKGLEYIELYWSNREEYEKNELLRQIRDKDTSIEWLERAIEEEKKRERLH